VKWLGRALLVAAALVAANRVLLVVAMEPWGIPAPGGGVTRNVLRPVNVAWHVHSSHSHDGGGTVDDIRAAAREAGIAAVALTDHNTLAGRSEATNMWPAVVVGEEVSTKGGHLVALGLREEALKGGLEAGATLGEALDAIDGRGGLAVVAHPSHPRIPWDRSGRERVRGLEIYNADEDWRDEGIFDLVGSLLTYPVAPVRSLSLLIDRPSRNLALWDSLLAERDVVGVGACDAHARLDLPGGARLAFPGYWETFCLVSTAVWPWWRISSTDTVGEHRPDAAVALQRNLESGRATVVLRSLGVADGFRFQARRGAEVVWSGGRIALRAGQRTRMMALVPGGRRAIVRVLKDGRVWREGRGPLVDEEVTEPGVYRCEVYQSRPLPPFYREKEFPWIFSNAIRVVTES
jgi:hypothetical protein